MPTAKPKVAAVKPKAASSRSHVPRGIPSPRDIPSPLVPLSSSFSPANTPKSRREASFFNPALGTPNLSPGPTEQSSVPLGASPGPWVVSPPPPSMREKPVDFESSPGKWIGQYLRRPGLASNMLACALGTILFFVVLGAYVLLTYLAITTKRTKYIIFLSILAAVMLLIAFNLHAGQQVPENLNKPSRFMTEEEENAVIRRAYGKEVPL